MAFFIPHAGCPHQCSFCDQKSITGESRRVEPGEVAAVLEDARQALRGKQKASEIAFFGGSFTAVPPAYQESLLKAAYPFVKRGDFSGIRISCRPHLGPLASQRTSFAIFIQFAASAFIAP